MCWHTRKRAYEKKVCRVQALTDQHNSYSSQITLAFMGRRRNCLKKAEDRRRADGRYGRFYPSQVANDEEHARAVAEAQPHSDGSTLEFMDIVSSESESPSETTATPDPSMDVCNSDSPSLISANAECLMNTMEKLDSYNTDSCEAHTATSVTVCCNDAGLEGSRDEAVVADGSDCAIDVSPYDINAHIAILKECSVRKIDGVEYAIAYVSNSLDDDSSDEEEEEEADDTERGKEIEEAERAGIGINIPVVGDGMIHNHGCNHPACYAQSPFASHSPVEAESPRIEDWHPPLVIIWHPPLVFEHELRRSQGDIVDPNILKKAQESKNKAEQRLSKSASANRNAAVITNNDLHKYFQRIGRASDPQPSAALPATRSSYLKYESWKLQKCIKEKQEANQIHFNIVRDKKDRRMHGETLRDILILAFFLACLTEKTKAKAAKKALETVGSLFLKNNEMSYRRVIKWGNRYYRDGEFGKSKQGKHAKTDSIISNEEVRANLREMIAEELPKNLTSNKFLSKLVGGTTGEESWLMRITNVTGVTCPPTVCLRTAERWLHFLGYEISKKAKGFYTDKHEDPKQVEARKEFITAYKSLESRMSTYDENGTRTPPVLKEVCTVHPFLLLLGNSFVCIVDHVSVTLRELHTLSLLSIPTLYVLSSLSLDNTGIQ